MTGFSASRRIAEDLLEIGAVTFAPDSPFTWASGMKSPVYCDNRLTISYPAVRSRIRDGFRATLKTNGIEPEVIVGTATAGIPHAAWLAGALELPMAYVRSQAKAHGTSSQIEGKIESGTRVVVIEDLVSTGRSSGRVVEALRREGANVAAVLAIFSYELEHSTTTFRKLDVPLYTLTNFDELFAVAGARSELADRTIRSIREWRNDPEAWSARRNG